MGGRRAVSAAAQARREETANRKRPWTEREVLHLKLLFGQGRSDEQIALTLGRTACGVGCMRRRNRLNRPTVIEIRRKRNRWTKEEEEFIRLWWRELSDEKIGRKLRKSAWRVQRKRLSMGFKKERRDIPGRRRGWGYRDEETLKELYPRHSAKEIQRYLRDRHTEKSIQQKAAALGLRKEKRGRCLTVEEYYRRAKSGVVR